MRNISLLGCMILFMFTSCGKKDSMPSVVISNTVDSLVLKLSSTEKGSMFYNSVGQNNGIDSIPPYFEGLSYEIGTIRQSASFFLDSKNTKLVQLIRNLGSGVLRLGGSSSDKTIWYNGIITAETPQNMLTQTEIDNLSDFSKAIGWPVLFGLNLGNYDTTIASSESQDVVSKLGPNLYAFQFGNEPNLYYINGLRGSQYNYNNYLSEWKNYYNAVKNHSYLIAGPDVNNDEWISSYANDLKKSIILLDGHHYSTGPASDASITYQTILDPSRSPTALLNSFQTTAKNSGIPYRISECNSIYSGGRAGVSDVFASTLWGLDFMWQVAMHKGQGINFHGGTNIYTPIAYENGETNIRPLYYAMLAFHLWAKGNIISVTKSPENKYVNAYACTQKGNNTYITIINKGNANTYIKLQFPSIVSNIQTYSLSAPSVLSKTNITLGGSSVNENGTFKLVNAASKKIVSDTTSVSIPAFSAIIVATN